MTKNPFLHAAMTLRVERKSGGTRWIRAGTIALLRRTCALARLRIQFFREEHTRANMSGRVHKAE